MEVAPKGEAAARLRQRKFELMRTMRLPSRIADLLPGCLSLTHRKCGRGGCHCAAKGGEGHPEWKLAFMSRGKRRVERVPEEWVEEVRRKVEAGRSFKDAVAEVLAANAELLVLWRKQKAR